MHLQNTKNKSVFFLICSFFTCLVTILCINAFHHFVLFRLVETQDESALFLIVFSQSLYIIILSTFCTWIGSLKETPLICRFSWWSLNFLKTRLTSAEFRMSKLSKVWYQNKWPMLQCFTLDKFLFSAC